MYFPPAVGLWETLSPDSLNWHTDSLSALQQYLEDTHTKAFIILKDGRMVCEWYYDSFTKDSVWFWASAGKTMTATLVGIAQQEGFLSIDSSSANYLGAGWTSCSSPEESAITVKHQLSMTAGLNEQGYRWDCTDDTCLQCEVAPGSRWFYHNAPYTLLTDVVEGATGRNINQYFLTRIGTRIGMNGAYVRLGYNRIFFSQPRSMARFGLLMLNRGVWNGTPILSDSSYHRAMTSPSQSFNPAYGYLWWLNGQQEFMLPSTRQVFSGEIIPNAPDDMVAALGAQDQKIYVVPSQGLVVIRMGRAGVSSQLSLSNYDDVIWGKISRLTASNTTRVVDHSPTNFQLFPNPAKDELNYVGPGNLVSFKLYTLPGELISHTHTTKLSLQGVSPGTYLVVLDTGNGREHRELIHVSP